MTEPPAPEPSPVGGEPDAVTDGRVEFWQARRRPRWLVVLVALVGSAVIVAVQFGLVRERIEDRLAATSRQALDAAGFTAVDVTMRGRDAVLAGSVPTAREAADVISTVEAVRGVRVAEFEGPSVVAAAPTSGATSSSSSQSPQTPSAATTTTPTETAPTETAPTETASTETAPESLASAPGTGAAVPDPLTAVTERLARLDPITFAATSSELTPESYVAVASAAQIINAADPATGFAVIAHTDSAGAVEDNDVLSEQRARAVVAALVEAGVAPQRLEPEWFGERRPVVTPELSDADKAANRRVELVPLR